MNKVFISFHIYIHYTPYAYTFADTILLKRVYIMPGRMLDTILLERVNIVYACFGSRRGVLFCMRPWLQLEVYGAQPGMEVQGWRFRDFESRQYVSNSFTGETLCAYGPNEEFDGGPFSNLQDFEGDPVLLGKAGTDEDRSIIFVRRAAKVELPHSIPEGSTSAMGAVMVRGADGAMETWATDGRWQYETKYLHVPCGESTMKAECYWLAVGPDYNVPFRLWVGLPAVMNHLYQVNYVPRRKMDRWDEALQKLGMSKTHLRVSDYAEARVSKKRKFDADVAAPSPAMVEGHEVPPGFPQSSISVSGLVGLMVSAYVDTRFRRITDTTFTSADSVLEVAKTFLDVVLADASITLPTSPRVKVVNGLLDAEALGALQNVLGFRSARIAG